MGAGFVPFGKGRMSFVVVEDGGEAFMLAVGVNASDASSCLSGEEGEEIEGACRIVSRGSGVGKLALPRGVVVAILARVEVEASASVRDDVPRVLGGWDDDWQLLRRVRLAQRL